MTTNRADALNWEAGKLVVTKDGAAASQWFVKDLQKNERIAAYESPATKEKYNLIGHVDKSGVIVLDQIAILPEKANPMEFATNSKNPHIRLNKPIKIDPAESKNVENRVYLEVLTLSPDQVKQLDKQIKDLRMASLLEKGHSQPAGYEGSQQTPVVAQITQTAKNVRG